MSKDIYSVNNSEGPTLSRPSLQADFWGAEILNCKIIWTGDGWKEGWSFGVEMELWDCLEVGVSLECKGACENVCHARKETDWSVVEKENTQVLAIWGNEVGTLTGNHNLEIEMVLLLFWWRASLHYLGAPANGKYNRFKVFSSAEWDQSYKNIY